MEMNPPGSCCHLADGPTFCGLLCAGVCILTPTLRNNALRTGEEYAQVVAITPHDSFAFLHKPVANSLHRQNVKSEYLRKESVLYAAKNGTVGVQLCMCQIPNDL